MLEKISARRIRRDILKLWEQVNPILQEREIGFEIDTNRMREGDGITKFMDLPYYEEVDK